MTQPRYGFIAMFLLILAAPFAVAQNGDPFGDDWIQEVPNPFNPFERQESAAPEVESPDQTAKSNTKAHDEYLKRRQEEFEAISERKSNAEKKLEAEQNETIEILKKLQAQLSVDQFQQVERMWQKSFARRAQTEEEVFRLEEECHHLEDQIDLIKNQHSEKLTEVFELNEDVYRELNEVKENCDDYRHQLWVQQKSFDVVQIWLAHALESIENPELQNWVLARLKSSPELTRQLIESHSAIQPPTREPSESRLETVLKDLAQQPNSSLGKIASEIVLQINPKFTSPYTFPANTTSRWPILPEVGRNREQELLEKIDEQIELNLSGIFFEDVIDSVNDLYKLPIMMDSQVAEIVSESIVEFEFDQVISLRSILHDCLPQLGLTFQVRDECLLITTMEQALANPIRRVYQVSADASSEQASALAKTLIEAINSPELKIIPTGDRLIVIGSEEHHFEATKLLTQLLSRE